MANTTQNTPNGFAALSKFLFALFMGILTIGIFGLIVSVVASVAYTKLPQKWLDVIATPFTWIVQYHWLSLALFGIFLLLIVVFYLMSRSSGSSAPPPLVVHLVDKTHESSESVKPVLTSTLPLSDQELAHIYCSRLNKGNERLTHDGIPAGLVDRRVKLDDVFIPLRFYRLDAPRDIFPYLDADLAHVRKGRELVAQQGGDIRPYNRIIELARQEGDFKADKTIDIATLWECMTPNEPMAFIEGIPGMGKSTLLTRIMLYMARRTQNIADPDMPQLTPVLIPVFVSLKKYATERDTPSNKLSLLDFLKIDIQEKFRDSEHVAALVAFIERQLKNRACIVFLDGIDEVSDPAMRQAVQAAIKDFIEEQSRQEKPSPTYNRFLITSRVAGYDKKGFEDYPHYLIARLTLEQMKDFLPRWCHANVSREMRDESEEDIRREADEITQILIKTVENNAAVRELAEIPLLLTMLAAMQQKGTTLPDRRAGLYKLVVRTLLTDRNQAKGIETLSVADAHQRLGPLAYEMHTHNSLALDEDYIHQKLAEAIHAQQAKPSPDEQETPIDDSEQAEAIAYLKRLSERGGLFVKRAGNYYDFSHRSFEEYFTAQYLLRQIEVHRQEGIQLFIERVARNYSLWREPYLLAVASKSESDSIIASQLIQSLFQAPRTASDLNLLLLTATAIIEAEPDSIDLTLQREVADALIQRYTEALRTKKFGDCQRIEQVMTRWLLTLPKDAFRPPVLQSLYDHILNAQQAEQRATLKLLALIMQDILTGSQKIFDELMPMLLALSGQPAIEGNERTVKPSNDVSISSDLIVQDLAFTVLSVMGRRGPGGLLLSKIREEIEPYLEQLALYSLECGILITPTNIPLSEGNYESYEAAVVEWITLREELEKRHRTGADVTQCAAIHKALLIHAEDVNYSTAPVIVAMLHASANSSRSWQEVWQAFLLNNLKSERNTGYFNSALLWNALFIQEDEQKKLAGQLKLDFQNPLRQLSSTNFIAYVAEDFRDIQDYRGFQSFRDIQDLRDLQSFRGLQYLQYLQSFRDFRDFRDLRYLQALQALQGSQALQDFQYFRYLRNSLFTNEVAQISLQHITHKLSDSQVDLLLILLGRILQIGEDKIDTSPERETQQEIQHIVKTITPFFTSTIDDVRDAALDVLRYLPARTENEIRFVIEGAEQAQYEQEAQVRDAYCYALQRARPLKDEWDNLERMGMQSQVKEVREVTEAALRRRIKVRSRG